MKEKDGIDIVVVNANNAGDIEPCINSITRNTQGIVNLIVVDQDSTDGSKNWLITKRLHHLILNNKDMGLAGGKNQGARECQHSWVCFIAPKVQLCDDEWLDKMWNYIHLENVGWIEGAVTMSGEKKYIGTGFCMVSKRALYQIGLFDPFTREAYELDFLIRLRWAGFGRVFCPDVGAVCKGERTAVDFRPLARKHSSFILDDLGAKIIQETAEAEMKLKEARHG